MLDSVKTVAGLYEVNTSLLARALEGLSEADLFQRPGEVGNPILWITGHVTSGRFAVCRYLDVRKQWPYGDRFGRGAEIGSPGDYPGIRELLHHWESISAHLREAFRHVTEEQLAKPVERGFPGVSQTVNGAIHFLHFHESYHVGQMAYIRRLLGYSQLVG